jgi:hypothetical protein
MLKFVKIFLRYRKWNPIVYFIRYVVLSLDWLKYVVSSPIMAVIYYVIVCVAFRKSPSSGSQLLFGFP